LLFCLLLLCLGDILWSMFRNVYPYITNFLRPVVVAIFLSQIRSNLKSIALDLRDSMTVLIIIFGYVFFFAFAAYFLF